MFINFPLIPIKAKFSENIVKNNNKINIKCKYLLLVGTHDTISMSKITNRFDAQR